MFTYNSPEFKLISCYSFFHTLPGINAFQSHANTHRQSIYLQFLYHMHLGWKNDVIFICGQEGALVIRGGAKK